ncbi:MAG: hypothetical protein WKG32_16265 [Gemmatimonadaceae bacterium]
MRHPLSILLALLGISASAHAQHPLRHFTDAVEARFARSQPVIRYVLRASDADSTRFDVEVHLRGARDTFQVAMAKHPEYDDRFWRFVEGLRVESRVGGATVTREDSALWRVIAPGGEATLRYSLHLPPAPPAPRPAWRPFLSPTGGLVGSAHAFMYVVGAELAPAHVTLELPAAWRVATGLEPTADPRTFFAPSAYVLVESPILVGRLRSWRFAVDGVPHRVVYWPRPDATPFDTAAFVSGLERLTRQAVALFGRAPYREYTFLYQDAAYGALEHPNSVTLGAPSADLARDVHSALEESAHEFVHTWNIMRIRPAEYRGVDYRAITPPAGLWFSEGLSMFYADLLLRRAGLPVEDSTRIAHLEHLITRYLASPGNAHFSAEQLSRVAYGSRPDALGDYEGGPHLPGELIGAMLDLVIRDATSSRRSMDDVMRTMLERFSGEQGFTGADVERVVREVCACEVHALFEGHVRGASVISFDRYLALAGLRTRVTRTPVLRDGQPEPDYRIRAWIPPGDSVLALLLSDPASVWGRAGLHTGDRLTAVNGTPMRTSGELRSLIGRLRVGDTVRVALAGTNSASVRPASVRPPGARTVTVVVTGYDQPVVRIEEVPGASDRSRALRERWLSGAP